MGIMRIPYNPQSDPFQYWGQALQGFVRGQTDRAGGKMEEEDLDAILRNFGEMMTAQKAATASGLGAVPNWPGARPQQPKMQTQFGRDTLTKSLMGGQNVGSLPGWWNMATPEQKQGYLDRVGGQNINIHGLLPSEARGLSGQELEEYLEALRKKKLDEPETPLTEPQVSGYGEAMQTRIDRVDRFRPGMKDFDEGQLFKEWQKFVGMFKFKNDTQREQAWNVWRNKLNNLGGELEWDEMDPKWRAEIGLGAPAMGAGANLPDIGRRLNSTENRLVGKAKQYKDIAISDKTGAKIGSNDGGKTWHKLP